MVKRKASNHAAVTIGVRRELARLLAAWEGTTDPPAVLERVMRPAPGPRLPGSVAALDARETAHRDLALLAESVAAVGQLHPPTGHRTVVRPMPVHGPLLPGARRRTLPVTETVADDVVPVLVSWLSTHAELVAQVDGQADRRIRRYANALADLAEGTRRGRVPLGPCPVGPCRGKVVAVVVRGDLPLPPTISCTGQPRHVWGPDSWHALGRAMRRRLNEPAARALVAEITRGDTTRHDTETGA